MDIHDYEDRFALFVDPPGVDPAQVGITLANGVLTLSGQPATEKPVSTESDVPTPIERGSGAFHRRFILPDSIDGEQIKASGLSMKRGFCASSSRAVRMSLMTPFSTESLTKRWPQTHRAECAWSAARRDVGRERTAIRRASAKARLRCRHVPGAHDGNEVRLSLTATTSSSLKAITPPLRPPVTPSTMFPEDQARSC